MVHRPQPQALKLLVTRPMRSANVTNHKPSAAQSTPALLLLNNQSITVAQDHPLTQARGPGPSRQQQQAISPIMFHSKRKYPYVCGRGGKMHRSCRPLQCHADVCSSTTAASSKQ